MAAISYPEFVAHYGMLGESAEHNATMILAYEVYKLRDAIVEEAAAMRRFQENYLSLVLPEEDESEPDLEMPL